MDDGARNRVARWEKNARRVVPLVVDAELAPQRAREILVIIDLQVVLIG